MQRIQLTFGKNESLVVENRYWSCNPERELAKKSKQKLEVYRLCRSVTGKKPAKQK